MHRNAGSPAPVTGTGTGRPREDTTQRGQITGAAADIAAILPAARAARDELHVHGQPLTRDALAARLRQADHQVRNARLTPILDALRSEPAAAS